MLSRGGGAEKECEESKAARQDSHEDSIKRPRSAAFARLTQGLIFAGKEKSSDEIIQSLRAGETHFPYACPVDQSGQQNLPEQLRLDYWKRRVKSATVTSRQVVSPLLLPNGLHPMYLEAVWTVHSESDDRHH